MKKDEKENKKRKATTTGDDRAMPSSEKKKKEKHRESLNAKVNDLTNYGILADLILRSIKKSYS